MKNTQIWVLCASFVMSVQLLQNIGSDILDQHVFMCDCQYLQYLQEEHCSPGLSHSAEYCM